MLEVPRLAVDVIIEFIYVDLLVHLLVKLVSYHPYSPGNAQKSLASSGLRSFIKGIIESIGVLMLKSVGVLLLKPIGERVGLLRQVVVLERGNVRPLVQLEARLLRLHK